MSWTCGDYERWLDVGRPANDDRPANAHAASCERCRAALAASRAIEEALAHSPAEPAPAGFTDAVMRQVASTGRVSERSAPRARALSFWVRVAGDPLLVTLCALAALVAWGWPAACSLAAAIVPRLAAWGGLAGRWWAAAIEVTESGLVLRPLDEPAVTLGLSVAAAAGLLWVSWHLARWSEQAVARPFTRAVRAR